jgi:hypothetical protein
MDWKSPPFEYRPIMHRAHITILCELYILWNALVANSNIAPLLEDVDISYGFIQYEGSLMNENIFRQMGSPEVDAAWESLGIECNRSTCTLLKICH